MQNLFFKELQTPRLRLRLLKVKDAYPLSALRSNAGVNRFIARAQTMSMPEGLVFINKTNAGIQTVQWLYWAITQVEDDTLIGTLCLFNFSFSENCAEVGFELSPDFHQRGFTNEALEAVIQFAFTDLQLLQLKAYTMRLNNASVALLLKNGFVLVENRNTAHEGASAKYELLYVLNKNE